MGSWLFRPVDIAPLVFFRVVAGTLIAVECAGHGLTRFAEPYVEASVNFSWPLTPWLHPGPAEIVYAHMALNCAAALMVATGLFYRAAAVTLCVGLALLLGMEKTAYINHTYLYSLFAGILACVPAHRALSLDSRRRPELAGTTAPAWGLYLLRFQMGVVYVFAGIAKLDPDWLRSMPLKVWLSGPTSGPLSGIFAAPPWWNALAAWTMSYGGLLVDLLIVPAMLFRATRVPAFLCIATFHVSNALVFGIGTFPWVSLAATALFFEPASFRRLPVLRDLPAASSVDGGEAVAAPRQPARARAWFFAPLAIYCAVQILIPCRRFFIEGNPAWTEVGHTFAWRMMLRGKQARLRLRLNEPATGRTWTEPPGKYLTPRQLWRVPADPEMIVQLARHVAALYAAEGRRVEVRADAFASLNGRPHRRLVREDVDLAALGPGFDPLKIVLPLETGD